MSVTAKHEKLTAWLAAYRALPLRERRLLELMSVLYTPMPARLLRDAAIKAQAFRPPRQHTQSLVTFIKLLKKLEAKDFVVKVADEYAVPPMSLEELTRKAVEDGAFDLLVKAAREVTRRGKVAIPDRYKTLYKLHSIDYPEGLRLARIAFYGGDQEEFSGWLHYLKKEYPSAYTHLHPLAAIFGKTTDIEWLCQLPQPHIWDGLFNGFAAAQWNLRVAGQTEHLATAYCDKHDDSLAESLHHELAYHRMLQGRWKTFAEGPEATPQALRGIMALLRGQAALAIEELEADLEAFRALTGEVYAFYEGLSGIILILALVKQGSPDDLRRAHRYLMFVLAKKHPLFGKAHEALANFIKFQEKTRDDAARYTNELLQQADTPSLESLFCWWLAHWISPTTCAAHSASHSVMQAAFTKADEAGYTWIAAEIGTLLAYYGAQTTESHQRTTHFWKSHDASALSLLFQSRPAWEYSLEALRKLVPQIETIPNDEERLAWRIQIEGKQPGLQAYLQKKNAKGNWSKGRKLELQKLGEEAHSEAAPGYLSEPDMAVCQHIQRDQKRAWAGWGKFNMNVEDAILSLVDHPRVFWADQPHIRVDVTLEEANLQLLSDGDYIQLRLDPPMSAKRRLAFRRVGNNRLVLIKVTGPVQQIAAIVGKGIQIPKAAQAQVLDVIHGIAPLVRVQSDIESDTETFAGLDHIKKLDADPRLVVRLAPNGSGLSLHLSVRPFGIQGPRLSPGGGGASMFATIKGRTCHARRDLNEELRRRATLLIACPLLDQIESSDGVWMLDDPEECIALLAALEELGKEITIEWPKGQHLRIKAHVGSNNFKASVQQDQDWFSLSGELEVDPSLVMNLRQLLQLTAQHSGRFVPLGEGEFLALSEGFRNRLDALAAYTEAKDDIRTFHSSASFAMQELLDEFGDSPQNELWRRHTKRLQERIEVAVPASFKGTLRDYQREGFTWMVRLAHWGFGACLADQMGLGKTLQALALLLHRVAGGPALVIAPTSVCANWFDEAQRFAPSLRVSDLGSYEIAKRAEVLEELGPGDLLLCSYGLLPFAQGLLTERTWHTVILDEAQAIKNPTTQRAQAAMALQADCRVITTGTPIENHLGDLWSLFRFLNPGLLGAWQSFQHTFAVPIERGEDSAPREQLKQLVQPFILRRLKLDVLDELPPRTEVTLRINPSPEEAALYEALRQEALERITASEMQAGQLHLHILKELTRLRLACCHPALVVSDKSLPGAKHDAFAELIEGLLDEGHKVLVFSQFVRHLGLLREILEARDIDYQYLDGSTPVKARRKSIAAFQEGEGDVFLISLKAGGSGINLTAADYVIHMDPWWNPAVEDQASDRAHRIGQTNPVTIYRLIMQGSIEEKIVDLHQHKRDLAESLLEGSEMTGKMTADQLMNLIRDGR